METNSNSVDSSGLQDEKDDVSSSGSTSPLTKVKSSDVGQAGERPVDEAVRCVKPGSVTLMENLEQKRRESGKVVVDQSQSVLSTGASTRPLPKALQPKETRRSWQPVSPTLASVYTTGTGYSQLSAGVNVSDSVLRQQRRRSSSEFTTSPTALPPNTASSPTHVSAKPEVVLERPETERDSSFGGRRVVCEPNPGLATLRATQLHHVTRKTTHRPEVEMSPVNRHQSKSFADRLAVFQSPSSTTSKLKSPCSYIPSPSVYSKFNNNKFEFDEPPTSPSIATSEPKVDSASMSNAVCDPSPTISKLLRNQRSINDRKSERRLETQASCPETIPVPPRAVIQIRKSVASPTSKDENSSDVSVSGLTQNSVDSSMSSNSNVRLPVERQKVSDVDCEWSNPAACKVEAASRTTKESENKAAAADDGDDEDADDKAKASSGSDIEHPPPPLPSSPPPPLYVPLDVEGPEELDNDDEDR